MSLYRCHQPGRLACSARLSSCSRSTASDAVVGQQVEHVDLADRVPAEFDPADLRLRRADRPRRFLRGDAAALAQPPQLDPQQDAQHGWPFRRLRHARPPGFPRRAELFLAICVANALPPAAPQTSWYPIWDCMPPPNIGGPGPPVPRHSLSDGHFCASRADKNRVVRARGRPDRAPAHGNFHPAAEMSAQRAASQCIAARGALAARSGGRHSPVATARRTSRHASPRRRGAPSNPASRAASPAGRRP